MRRFAPLIIGLTVLVVIVVIEAFRPQPFDERLRLERSGTEPFDAEMFYELLPEVMDAPVVPVEQTPFEKLADSTLTGTAYVFLADDFAPDPAEAGRLLAYAERGNTVFVSARTVSGALFEAIGAPPDTLGRHVEGAIDDGFEEYILENEGGIRSAEEPLFGLTDLQLADSLSLYRADSARVYHFPLRLGSTLFDGFDSERTDLLGDAEFVPSDMIIDGGPPLYYNNFLRVRAGRGAVILHGAPVAFTNAALAPPDSSDAAAYLADVLSFVPPVDSVFWDEVYKPLRAPPSDRLSVARQDPALRWGITLVLLATLFFIAFRGRRWQRPVPVVTEPPNAQREFARVLGRLHLTRGERGWLARRKAKTVRERLRSRYGLGPDLDDATARAAAARAGRSEAAARTLFARVRRAENTASPSETDLMDLDRAVDSFFREDADGSLPL